MSRSYCYGSLLPGVIRLLRLFPNEDKSALLQCQLFDYSLQGSDTRTHPYDALSYVWGGSEKPEAIYISEYTLPVTANLHEALLRLRHHSIERIIWVDAICIDQGNDREKEQQIQIMAKIYAQANRVVVLLGEAADDSSLVLETIRSVGYKKSIDYSGDQKIRKSILALLQRPWFRRIWVLQEVAAARYVLVVCGPTEVDGYAFCLGLNSLTKFYKEHADMQILAHPITSLINEAIFRPSYGSSNSGRVSLDICPLGELIDRYHTHEATRHHDKLYALLGMCSDNISEPLLSPNYRNSWKDVLRSLVKFLLGENISIEIWDDKDITIIESKGYVLGKVSSVKSEDDGQGVNIIFKSSLEFSGKIEAQGTYRTLQNSAKAIREGDIVCLLQGAPRPIIIRPCKEYFVIIMVSPTQLENIQITDGIKQSHFTRHLLLIWDWGNYPEIIQNSEKYESSVSRYQRGLPGSDIEANDNLGKATRTWNVALVLGDLEEHEKSEGNRSPVKWLREAIEGYELVFGVKHSQPPICQYGLTPLSWAAWNGYDTIRYFLPVKDIDLDLKDSQHGRTPLSWAAHGGHTAVVKLLLDTGKVDINSKDKSGRTPFSWAVQDKHKDVIKLLLEIGEININSKDKDFQIALLWAIEEWHEIIVKLLFKTGRIIIKLKNEEGQTSFSWAAPDLFEAIAELLFKASKADMESKDNDDPGVLSRATLRGHKATMELFKHESIIKLLLETSKVDVDSKDELGRTLLSWAAKSSHEVIVKFLLKTSQVDVNSRDHFGLTPLLCAVESRNEAIVKLLLETGQVDVDSKDQFGRTPLSWAAAGRWNEAIVKFLLKTGQVDVDSKDRFGRTPLFQAVKEGNEAIVKLLLETGQVDVNSRDEDGNTPLSWAAKEGDKVIIELLTKASSTA